jgi:hypothetical protein
MRIDDWLGLCVRPCEKRISANTLSASADATVVHEVNHVRLDILREKASYRSAVRFRRDVNLDPNLKIPAFMISAKWVPVFWCPFTLIWVKRTEPISPIVRYRHFSAIRSPDDDAGLAVSPSPLEAGCEPPLSVDLRIPSFD